MEFIKPTSIIALPESNNVLVHCETALFSYPLDLFIRVSQRNAAIQELNHSTERLAQKEHVLFVKAGRVAKRTLGKQSNNTLASISHSLQIVAYATKSFVNVTLSILEPVHRNRNRTESSYRPFGSVSLQSFFERFMFANQPVAAGACSTRYPRRDIPTTEYSNLLVKIHSLIESDEVCSP